MAKSKDNSLSKKELEYYWELLLKKRAEILGDVNQMETSAIKRDSSERASSGSSMPIHMADIGSDNFEQDFTLGLIDSERRLLDAVSSALGRIKRGTFGICLGTGKQIQKRRLEAMPWAKYCIDYATQIEKGLAEEVDDDDD